MSISASPFVDELPLAVIDRGQNAACLRGNGSRVDRRDRSQRVEIDADVPLGGRGNGDWNRAGHARPAPSAIALTIEEGER
jgi:hypothetical protein